ncbi:porin family protein [Dyella monticola]|uniref:Porin family protein n=1 Tax=Dyella monticola TaxID=1927958 RepID=A0A370X3L8_9GAMM|nr:porin family protein [Dyella monticola]RDS82880.1 porin family protein [Dyella monticola]
MKKTLFAMALAAVGFAAVPAAFAQSAPTQTAQQGWYVGAEAGYGQINKGPYDTNGDAIGGIKGGYRFAINPQMSVGVEAGFQYLGRIDARGAARSDSSLQSKLYGPTLGANLRYNFTPNWYGEVRGGAFYAQGQGLTDRYNATYERFDRTRYYAGVGVGYNLTQNWSVGVNYNYYDGSGRGQGVQLPTNAYTVSAEYRF